MVGDVVKLADLKVGERAVSKSGGAWVCTADGVSSIDGIGGVGVLWYPSEFTVAEELFGPFRLLADPKPEPTTTGARTGRDRVRDLIDGCGGPAKAAAATGILPNTIAEYLRIGEVTRTEHAVALCNAANWSVGLVGGLSGLPESGRVRARSELGARWKRGARAAMVVGEDD